MKWVGKLAREAQVAIEHNATSALLYIYGDHAAELNAMQQCATRREADRPTRGEDAKHRSPVAAARSEAERTGPTLDIEIKPHRQRRSLDANALCWALCSQIGQALHPPLGREEVYRRAIREVGQAEHLLIREDALEDFSRAYGSNGIGWFVLKVDDAPLRGYVEVLAYQGSSSYDTKAMSTLIDYLVDEAEQMELPIALERREIEKIKEDWRKHDL